MKRLSSKAMILFIARLIMFLLDNLVNFANKREYLLELYLAREHIDNYMDMVENETIDIHKTNERR